MAKTETKMILVKKIRHHNEQTKYTVFTGELLRKKRNGTWMPTKKIDLYVGFVFSVYQGDRLSVSVKLVEDRIYGTEYAIHTYHREAPGTLDEIRKFLNSIHGLGSVSVKKLIDKFGLDVLDIIQKDNQALESVGIKKDICKTIRDEIADNACFEEILTFLQLHKLDYRTAFSIFKKYGRIAVRKMKNNPYALYYDHIFSFRDADKLNYSLKNPVGDNGRFSAGLVACMQRDSESNGNLFIPYAQLKTTLEDFLNAQGSGFPKSKISDNQIHDAVSELTRANIIELDTVFSAQNPAVYLRENHWAENQIVQTIQLLATETKHFAYQKTDIDVILQQNTNGITLAPEQKTAIETALTSHISIITGGPGTGKTQTLNSLISVIRTLTPKAAIKLCAPTGKAALRISDLTNMNAATIHRTLKMGGYRVPLQAGELECDFLIIDEFSMVDCFLCAKLFQAAAPYARIVIVGDHEQLPSVGPGLVLRDMINSGKIPVTRLKTVFRQGKQSLIIKNANEVIHPSTHPVLTVNRIKHNGEFYFFQNASVTHIQKTIRDSIDILMTDYHMSQNDIKVLSPVHYGGLGVDTLNRELQEAFNPSGTPFTREDGLEIRKGDPVIHLHNDYDLDVFNGETGIVTDFGYNFDNTLLVTYPGNKRVWYNEEKTNELDLAYAMTIHKSQGSEFKAVILPVHESILNNLSKNILYTGITRAKQVVILIGTLDAFSLGARKSTTIQRNSNLAERLRLCL